MNPRDPAGSSDPFAEAAALIRDLGRSAQRARRYRALAATVADPMFDRALAIGSEIRRVARAGESPPGPAVGTAIAELRTLLEQCEAAIGGVKASAAYTRAAEAFASGTAELAAPLAAAIFTDVTLHSPPGTLYWPVPIGGERGGAAHFVPPADLAARLQVIAEEGLSPEPQPPDLGGDETIRPIALSEAHDAAESPIALAFEPRALPLPACRLQESGAVLLYALRTRAAFDVSCSHAVDDEWWSVRPDAYHDYLRDLRAALDVRALRLVIED